MVLDQLNQLNQLNQLIDLIGLISLISLIGPKGTPGLASPGLAGLAWAGLAWAGLVSVGQPVQIMDINVGPRHFDCFCTVNAHPGDIQITFGEPAGHRRDL